MNANLDAIDLVPAGTPCPPRGIVGRMFAFVGAVLPTVLVLALAGGIGWWGHRTGWKVPKFSALTGASVAPDDWCGEHTIPDSMCVECNADLLPRPTSYGWCKTHGVHECTLCHPELAQLPQRAKVGAEELERVRRALAFAERAQNNAVCKLHQRRLQFADVASVERAGIDIEPVWTAPVVEFVSAPGDIGYDQTKVAHLSARSAGTVWKIFKRLGDTVKAGDLVALVDATEVGKAKAEILQSFATVQLKIQTLASIKDSAGAVAGARVRESEAALRESEIRLNAARQALVNLGLPLEQAEIQGQTAEKLEARLHFLGIPEELTRTLDPKKVTSNLLPVIAPMDGIITSREVVAGEATDVARILFEIVDTRFLWINFDVKGEDATRIEVGQPVRFKPDNGRAELSGKIAWRSTQADVKTRTVKVRAELADPDRVQTANTFGSGKIILREEARAVVVPNAAVHWEGCCNIVFVRDKEFLKDDSPKVFHIRTVRLGARNDKQTELLAGVLPGELVAVKNSGVLRAELLRGSLGEG